jgi:hypothetical protein
MSGRVIGRLLSTDDPTIKRAGIKFSRILVVNDFGQTIQWNNLTMEMSVENQLIIGARTTFYFSKMWSTVYGVRVDGAPGRFHSDRANPLMLLMSLGMIFGGLATSVFLFPLLVTLAGIAGFVQCLDAMGAKARFGRDEWQAAYQASLRPPAP